MNFLIIPNDKIKTMIDSMDSIDVDISYPLRFNCFLVYIFTFTFLYFLIDSKRTFLLSKKHKFHDKIKTMIDSIKVPFYHSLNKFRMLMIKSFNVDPFICDKCGSIMEFHKLIC